MIENLNSKLDSHENLTDEEMTHAINLMMEGEIEQHLIEHFLKGLNKKGITVREISSAAKVMREKSLKFDLKDPNIIDTCGTGGTGLHIFNCSTASAIVATAAGAKVSKHGNRGISSKSGSADFLIEAGADINHERDKLAQIFNKVGFVFLFAPLHHLSMKHVMPARQNLATKTIFNLLGPHTNPSNAKKQIIGVYEKSLVEKFVNVSNSLGIQRVMIVHGNDGLDEITITGDSHVAELNQGKFSTYEINPKHFGIEIASIEQIVADSPKTSLQMVLDAFNGSKTPVQDMIALNAGSALYISGIAKDIKDGIDLAYATMHSGKAAETLAMYVDSSK